MCWVGAQLGEGIDRSQAGEQKVRRCRKFCYGEISNDSSGIMSTLVLLRGLSGCEE